jgi:hypothetical protein
MRLDILTFSLCGAFLLAACQPPPEDPATRSEPATPPAQPRQMPSPAPASASVATAAADAKDGIPLAAAAATTTAPADAATAVALVQAYYAAINAKDYARAYAMWSDDGRASGQTAEQFASGYASTEQVQVRVGTPGNAEGAAGSRYLEVPITVDSTSSDGEQRRYAGHFVLRAVMADGAPESTRQWHLYSAALQRSTP